MSKEIKENTKKLKAPKSKFKTGEKVFLKMSIQIQKLETSKKSFFLCPAIFNKELGDFFFLEIDGVEKLISSTKDLVLSQKEFKEFIKTL